MQAAHMIGVKEFHTLLKEDRKQTQFKTPGVTVSKKVFDGSSGTTKLDSNPSKKLIYSFKKESK